MGRTSWHLLGLERVCKKHVVAPAPVTFVLVATASCFTDDHGTDDIATMMMMMMMMVLMMMMITYVGTMIATSRHQVQTADQAPLVWIIELGSLAAWQL